MKLALFALWCLVWAGTCVLLYVVWQHAHWSVALCLTMLAFSARPWPEKDQR